MIGRVRAIAGGSVLLLSCTMILAFLGRSENTRLRAELEERNGVLAQLRDQGDQLRKDLLIRDTRIKEMDKHSLELQERLRQEQAQAAEALRKAQLAATASRKPDGTSKKQLEGLQAEMARLEQLLANANGRVNELKSENSRLRGNNDKLTAELAQSAEAAASVNNSMVVAARGKKKEKVVVKARRTQHLNIDLELPENMAKAVRTRITKPDGRMLEGTDPIISASSSSDPNDATAAARAGAPQRRMSRISMRIDPKKEKLVPGIYKVDVYSGNRYVGTTRTTLR